MRGVHAAFIFISARIHSFVSQNHMFDAVITHTSRPHFTVINSILYRLPRLHPFHLATIRTVQEERVNLAQAPLLRRLFDGLACSIVGSVDC